MAVCKLFRPKVGARGFVPHCDNCIIWVGSQCDDGNFTREQKTLHDYIALIQHTGYVGGKDNSLTKIWWG